MGFEQRIDVVRAGPGEPVGATGKLEFEDMIAAIRELGAKLATEAADPARELALGDWLKTLDPLAPEDRFPDVEDRPPAPIGL